MKAFHRSPTVPGIFKLAASCSTTMSEVAVTVGDDFTKDR